MLRTMWICFGLQLVIENKGKTMIYFDDVQQTFFDDAIHDSIPENARAIDEQQHYDFLLALNAGAHITHDLQILQRPSPAHFWQDGKWEFDEAVQKAEFQAAQTVKINELNATAQNIINQAAGTDKVPGFELQSWNLQAIEAKAWAQNPEVPTPILDKIALARGVPADALKQAALRKTQQYEALTAFVVGQRQALQTRIEAAKTLDELSAIEIAFRLPESGATS